MEATVDLKKRLHDFIDQADERILRILDGIANAENQSETQDSDIPDWHKKILDERLESYHKNPDNVKSFDTLLKSKREKYKI
ncbi:MAG: addiction module protein [Bergeyella sp.]